jgi:hypothetical protein
VNANDATLTGLATAHTGSGVHDHMPGAPASGGVDLILEGGRRRRPEPRRARRADDQRDRPDQNQPVLAAADPAPGFDAASRWGTQCHRPPTRGGQ